MKRFIAKSLNSKRVLKIAHLSAQLPVNVIIIGQSGVGKKLLSKEILPDAQSYEAKKLEKLIIENKIDVKSLNSIIIYDMHRIINKVEFYKNLIGVRIVATSFVCDKNCLERFAVKIEISPLEQRKEDLEELKQIYIKEAKKVYFSTISSKDIKIDLSGNGITLKQSIYKSVLLKSITKQDLMSILNNFFLGEFKAQKNYKQLLEIFEIPLLKAAREEYKSQLQMANKLNINRITLRKKLNKYFGE